MEGPELGMLAFYSSEHSGLEGWGAESLTAALPRKLQCAGSAPKLVCVFVGSGSFPMRPPAQGLATGCGQA